MAEQGRRTPSDPRPVGESHNPSSSEAATFTEEFSLCHQRDSLAREVGFAPIVNVLGQATEEVVFHSPADVGDIPYNFRVGSLMRGRDIRDCIKEYAIPDSFKCRRARNGETISCSEVGWIGVYPGHMLGGLRFPLHPFVTAFLFDINALPCQVGTNVWGQINAFIILCGRMNVVPDLGSFHELFQVKLSTQNGYYLYPRAGRKVFVTPTSTHPNR